MFRKDVVRDVALHECQGRKSCRVPMHYDSWQNVDDRTLNKQKAAHLLAARPIAGLRKSTIQGALKAH